MSWRDLRAELGSELARDTSLGMPGDFAGGRARAQGVTAMA